ncbi:MAG: Ig-like domain-containing protein, partial [Bacteroidota bacterium]|nr:Ig-like domain-containing protein [Bacteroidota bacterium]MDX5430225.1 Ig-like domain-containing protein [Bacteroidota bacterium]MDX5468986.1 Ig-like domain-containing protein [Bacteroidota bacterium]
MTIYDPPRKGSVVIQNGDSLFYTPDPNFFGYDTLRYQVCAFNPVAICDSAVVYIRVVPQVVASNDAYSLFMNRLTRNRVLWNDTVFGAYSTALVNLPVNGNATMLGDSIFYQAGLYYKGNDTLTYKVCSNLIPGYCDTARVVYTMNHSITTQDDAASTLEDVPVSVFVRQNDIALEPAGVVIMINPRRGSVNIINGDSVEYFPNPDYNGVDSFRYALCTIEKPSLCDTSWVRISILSQNDPPVASFDTGTTYQNRAKQVEVLLNDRDPDGDPMSIFAFEQAFNGAVSVEGKTLIYMPNTN